MIFVLRVRDEGFSGNRGGPKDMTRTTTHPLPDGENLAILKEELAILATKSGDVVSTLWSIRALSLTLWTAAVAVGLGNFAEKKQPIIGLLALTVFMPMLFFLADAKNNQWYRRVSSREWQIQQFLNCPGYVLPATGLPATLQSPAAPGTSQFPVYDLGGASTFGNDAKFRWETQMIRSMIDPIPTAIYWSQVFFSCAVCAISAGPAIRWIFVPSAIWAFLLLRAVGGLQKYRLHKNNSRIIESRTHNTSLMRFYILGINHCWQLVPHGSETPDSAAATDKFTAFLTAAIEAENVDLVCEESDPCQLSIAQQMTYFHQPRIPWRNINMSSQERLDAEIWEALAHPPTHDIEESPDYFVTIRHRMEEDNIREQFFASESIQAALTAGAKSVLILCGDMHVDYLRTILIAYGHAATAHHDLIPKRYWQE
jgi:hypothetical protein